MYQHKAPHRNWMPHPRFAGKYQDVTLPEPKTLFDDYKGRTRAAAEQEMTVARHLNADDLKLSPLKGMNLDQKAALEPFYQAENEKLASAKLSPTERTRWNYQRYVKDYLRCIDAVDEGVGRVLDYLDESQLAQDTIVIYTSDQGWYLGEHGWYDKRWMYEESFRTPFLVRWPGVVAPGTQNTDLVMNLDFAETFLEAAGAPVPADMQGRSLVPVLAGKTPNDWRKSVYYHYYEFPQPHHVQPHYGVRTNRYKLIHFYKYNEWELFDLEKDPQEMQSVYEDQAYRGVIEELKDELARLRLQYKDDGTIARFEGQP
jgi:arylsulfatase A-like enzyme